MCKKHFLAALLVSVLVPASLFAQVRGVGPSYDQIAAEYFPSGDFEAVSGRFDDVLIGVDSSGNLLAFCASDPSVWGTFNLSTGYVTGSSSGRVPDFLSGGTSGGSNVYTTYPEVVGRFGSGGSGSGGSGSGGSGVDFSGLYDFIASTVFPSGHYQTLQGSNNRDLIAGIDQNGDLRVCDPENMNNQAAFDATTGGLKTTQGDPSAVNSENIYNSYPDLEPWVSGGSGEQQGHQGEQGENGQQGGDDENKVDVPEEMKSFSLASIIAPLVQMFLRGVAVFLGLYFGLLGIHWVVKWWRRHYSAAAKAEAAHKAEMARLDSVSVTGKVEYLNEEGLDAYITEREKLGF